MIILYDFVNVFKKFHAISIQKPWYYLHSIMSKKNHMVHFSAFFVNDLKKIPWYYHRTMSKNMAM